MKTEPTSESISNSLEEDIALGRLHPKERLVEDVLMSRFKATRNSVRVALKNLEDIGIVARLPNKGAYVPHFQKQDVEELYVLRELLEGKAAELIPFPVSSKFLLQLREIEARHTQAQERNELAEVYRINLEFHRTLYSACSNTMLTEAVELYQRRTLGIRSYSISDKLTLAKVTKEHSHIIQALEDGDREKLADLVISHIQHAKKKYLSVNIQD